MIGCAALAADRLLGLTACGMAAWFVCASAASTLRAGGQIVLVPDIVCRLAPFGAVLGVAVVAFVLSGRASRLLAGRDVEAPKHGHRSIEAFAIYVALVGAPGWVSPAILGSVIYLVAPLLGLAWLWGRCNRTGRMRTRVGLSCERSVLAECKWGVVASFVLCPIAALIQLGGVWLGSARLVPATVPADVGRGIGLRVLLVVMWAPVVEEIMFRGVLYGGLRIRLRWLPAAIVCAFIWTSLHGPVSIWPSHFVVAIACAYLREWRGSVIASVVVHAAYNGMAMAPALKVLAGF